MSKALNRDSEKMEYWLSMAESIITVEGLCYNYCKLVAVDNISFNVKKGQIFSFLGPNGAGKTTTINILTTLLPVQIGKITISGFDVKEQPDEVRRCLGIVFQKETLDWNLKVWETLEFHGRLYSIPKKQRKARIEELLQIVELTDKRNEFVKNLSGGMKRRLEIARGLMTRPNILFLDEPTIGLDPNSRMKIWEYIKKVNKEGVTIFLTTHYMEEADQLSNEIYIMDKGKIITNGTSEQLKNSLGKDMVYLETTNDEKSKRLIEELPEVTNVRFFAKGILVDLKAEGAHFIPKIMETIRNEKIEVSGINLKKPTLDDVFIYFTGRRLKENNDGTVVH
jgi:ABC-2 type transport system ATP-binding protein